jgi:hypothetical protein
MQATIRPYVTTGVALVGASVIAVSSVAPPVLDTKLATPPVVSSTQLTSATNPLEAFAALFENSLDNGGLLVEQFLDSPAPILGQIVTNQLANIEFLGEIAQAFIDDLPGTIEDLQLAFELVGEALADGDFVTAGAILNEVFFSTALELSALAISPPLTILANTAQNIVNVVWALPTVLLASLSSGLAPLASLNNAVFDIVQTVADAAGGGDFLGAVGALVSAPIVITDALLNGYGPGGTPGIGLLSPGGPLSALLGVRNVIADQLDPVTDIMMMAKTTVSEPPDFGAESFNVTVSDGPQAQRSAFTAFSDDSGEGDDGSGEGGGGVVGGDNGAGGEEQQKQEEENQQEENEEEGGDDTGFGDERGDGNTANGGTDLSGGNKAEPGQTGGNEANTGGGDNGQVTQAEENTNEGGDGGDDGDNGSGGGDGGEGGSE